MNESTQDIAVVPAESEPRLARLKTAAERYAVCQRTIRVWVAQGKITGYYFNPRVMRVDLNEIDRLLIRRVPSSEWPTQGEHHA